MTCWRRVSAAPIQTEVIAMVLDPRFKKLDKDVCYNGGQELQDAAKLEMDVAVANVTRSFNTE